jgi:hypothetical protein
MELEKILNSYNLTELKKHVRNYNAENSIKGYSKLTKEELIKKMLVHGDKFKGLKMKEVKEPVKKVEPKKEAPKKEMKKEEPKKEMKKEEPIKEEDKEEKIKKLEKELNKLINFPPKYYINELKKNEEAMKYLGEDKIYNRNKQGRILRSIINPANYTKKISDYEDKINNIKKEIDKLKNPDKYKPIIDDDYFKNLKKKKKISSGVLV